MVVWGLSCHIWGIASQQRVLNTFPVSGYLRCVDCVVWLWHLLVNLYIWHIVSSCSGSISLTLGLVVRDSGLSILVSQLQVWLSAERAEDVSWPWLSTSHKKITVLTYDFINIVERIFNSKLILCYIRQNES